MNSENCCYWVYLLLAMSVYISDHPLLLKFPAMPTWSWVEGWSGGVATSIVNGLIWSIPMITLLNTHLYSGRWTFNIYLSCFSSLWLLAPSIPFLLNYVLDLYLVHISQKKITNIMIKVFNSWMELWEQSINFADFLSEANGSDLSPSLFKAMSFSLIF